eukprot:scaffold281179_cov31-Prasinocladus_malaysianus.AAC.1
MNVYELHTAAHFDLFERPYCIQAAPAWSHLPDVTPCMLAWGSGLSRGRGLWTGCPTPGSRNQTPGVPVDTVWAFSRPVPSHGVMGDSNVECKRQELM